MYPAAGISQLPVAVMAELLPPDDSDINLTHTLILNGGFIYFDNRHNPVAILAITGGGNNLEFEDPQEFPVFYLPRIDSSRFHDITIDSFREHYQRFCWLLPNEQIGAVRVGAHGAFVYITNNMDQAIYFNVRL